MTSLVEKLSRLVANGGDSFMFSFPQKNIYIKGYSCDVFFWCRHKGINGHLDNKEERLLR